MAYNEEEYPFTKITGINLCNNVRDFNQDALLNNNFGFDYIDSLLHAQANQYSYKVDIHHKLLTQERESMTPFPFGNCKSYFSYTGIDGTTLLKECKEYIRNKQNDVLLKLQKVAPYIAAYGLPDFDPIRIAAENKVIQDKIDVKESEVKAIQTKINNLSIEITQANCLNQYLDELPIKAAIVVQQDLLHKKEKEVEDLHWEKYCLFRCTSNILGNHQSIAEANVATHMLWMSYPLNIKITGVIITKHYPTFYVAKHTLEKYGHVVFWSTYTEEGYNDNWTSPYFSEGYLGFDGLSINAKDSSIIKIKYQKHETSFTSQITNIEEEIYVEPKEDYLVTCEMVGATGWSSPIYLTSKDCPSLLLSLEEQLLDKEYGSIIPIRQNNTTHINELRDDPINLSYEELLRHLYVSMYNLSDKIDEVGLEEVITQTQYGTSKLPLSSYISTMYFHQGISLATVEYSSIWYLAEFFNSLPTIGKDDFESYKESIGINYLNTSVPYLLENRVSIRNKVVETLISYSYIEKEIVGEELEVEGRLKGRVGNATILCTPGETLNVPYANNTRIVSQSLSGLFGYNFGLHGSPINLETSTVELKVQTGKGTILKLTIHGLYIKNTLNYGYPIKAEKDIQYLVDTYEEPLEGNYQSKKDIVYSTVKPMKDDVTKETSINSIIPSEELNLTGMVIPLWNHNIRTTDFRGLLYGKNMIDRVMYDSLNIGIVAALTDEQLDPFQVGTDDTWIDKTKREYTLTAYLDNFISSTQKDTESEEEFKERTKTFTKFKDDVTVAVNVAVNRYIPSKPVDTSKNPRFLSNQYRLAEVINTRKNIESDAASILVTNQI